jgi:tRNA A-37 threonylcarbamoyl transferase component Bud32
MQAVLRIAGYDSFEQIAVGGMAIVYKARKLSVKKTVAIKVLLPHLAADARFITRFQQEAEAAARIQHDNIVNVIDTGKADGAYFIVMEYYDGLTVEELLNSQPHLPIDVALSIVLHVCYGLEAAHAQNLVHRDVKPANIIVTRQGGIKVADFGLAKAIDKLNLVTHAGKVVGTPAYMSPEQTRGEAVGTVSDIFSLGVVAYEMLASKRPFEGASYSEIVDRIQNLEPQAVASFNPTVDEPFELIVRRMLSKSITTRYAHASEIVMELEHAMDQHGLRRDRRGLADFFKDPEGYTQSVNAAMLERLKAETPRGGGDKNRSVGARHYHKILHLNPDDDEAREALERIGDRGPDAGEHARPAGPARRKADVPAADPNADYRVVLEAIDREVETPDTFALKLSIRLKSPVTRMRQLVSRAPCVVAQRLPYKKARWLAKVIEELGGTARLDVVVDAAPVVEEKAAPVEAPSATPKPLERRTTSGGILCPRCGWEEEPDARFCSLCLQHFNKTDKIDAPNFASRPGFDDPEENPHSDGDTARAAPRGARSHHPRRAYFIGGAVVVTVLVVAVLLFAR